MVESAVVEVGSRVRILACGAEHEITIASSPDDQGLYRLSPRTPLAKALLGRRAGDEVKVETDAGTANYIVVSVGAAGS